MKRVAVVGRGTMGSIAAAYFGRLPGWEVDWYFDSNIPVASVGEATVSLISFSLGWSLGLTNNDIKAMNGTVKTGVSKRYWTEDEFTHPFPMGKNAFHFRAEALHDYIFEKIQRNHKVRIIDEHISDPFSLPHDHVLMCTGFPKSLEPENYYQRTATPVNRACVIRCNWDKPQFFDTINDAAKHGWFFGIPLQDQIAFGYIHNSNFTDVDVIEQELREFIVAQGIEPGETMRTISFDSYNRLRNFSDKVVYVGTASFFAEPLESTSLGFSHRLMEWAVELWEGRTTQEELEQIYQNELNGIDSLLALRYVTGSIYDTPFWRYAKKNAESWLELQFKYKTSFAYFIKDSLKREHMALGSFNCVDVFGKQEEGTWTKSSYRFQIVKFNLIDYFVDLIYKYDILAEGEELATKEELIENPFGMYF
jgi:hypothetical protein